MDGVEKEPLHKSLVNEASSMDSVRDSADSVVHGSNYHDDAEFEVTAEMMIHEALDDERTLEEEEALESQEDVRDELSDLQKESEIPIEELLARYSYGTTAERESSEGTSEDGEQTGQTSLADPSETSLIGHTSETSTCARCSPFMVKANFRLASVAGSGVPNLLSREVKTGPTGSTELPGSERQGDAIATVSEEDQPGPSGVSTASTSPTTVPTVLSRLHCEETLAPGDVPLMLLQNDVLGGNARLDHHLVHLSNELGGGAVGEKGEEGSSNDVGRLESGLTSVAEGTRSDRKRSNLRSRSSETTRNRLRPEFPERRSIRLMMVNDDRASVEAYFASVMEEGDEGSDDDEEYVPNDEWRQEIKVGLSHQAVVPELPSQLPYSLGGIPQGELLWSPQGTSEDKVSEYLETLSEHTEGVALSAERDNEQALQVLQRCNHDVQKALKQSYKEGISRKMKPWTEEECQSFESGLRAVGKDFFQLRKQVPSRSVKELVEFYYLWKKTERYDVFLQQGRIGKKKLTCAAGHVSDFMDKYLDVCDPDADVLHYGTTTVLAEVKKESS